MPVVRRLWFGASFACLLVLGLALGWAGAGISSAQVSPTGDQWQKIPDVPASVDFRDYWEQHGGLAQFGYPLTEEFMEVSSTDGRPYTTQYFERARFEYHPENPPPYDVLLGLLGRMITEGRDNEAPFMRTPAHAGPGTIYFDVTGHNMPRPFSGYWQEQGGLPVYGYPISEAFDEVSLTDGKTYLVQYFERNRLEYHPELNDLFKISLGLLGVQVLQDRGWIPGPVPLR